VYNAMLAVRRQPAEDVPAVAVIVGGRQVMSRRNRFGSLAAARQNILICAVPVISRSRYLRVQIGGSERAACAKICDGA
jgi:hypothetical protein